jgi:hypothetical protein
VSNPLRLYRSMRIIDYVFFREDNRTRAKQNLMTNYNAA